MINRLKSKSEFSKNVITLMTGTTVAQAIPIAITPILTRMYTPEDFGVLALFVAITSIFGAIANGRYELAIMLPVKDDDAINIAAMGMVIATLISLFLFIPAIFMNEYIVDLLDNDFIGFWLYFVPLVVWLLGLFNILSYLNNRLKSYKIIAKATIYKSFAQAVVQLIFGVIKSTASGLITGQIFSSLVANTSLAKNVIAKYQLKNINWKSMKNQAIRYINFPKYSMWSILANVMSVQLINILITFYYSVATLGFYSLAQRILGLPASLIGSSIGQVYFQQATVEKNETGKAVKVFKATSKKLIILSCIFFIPLYFVLPFTFALAFGEKWMIAGVYSQIILPVFVFRFVSAALSTTNSVFEKQRLSLAWQVILLFLSLAIFFVGNFYQLDFIDFLKVYSLVISLHYVLLYVLLGLVADKRI